jgi:inosine/xanthosine triphosphatase
MKVGIGTKNPLKVKVVKDVFEKAFGNIELYAVDVYSGVSIQPKEEDILKGALNRAKKSLRHNDFGVGIEAGTIKFDKRIFVTGYCVIIDKNGKFTTGSQPIFELPKVFKERIEDGEELGVIVDDFFKTKNIKHSIGLVGILSNKLVTREDLIKSAVSTALIPWISKNIYSD